MVSISEVGYRKARTSGNGRSGGYTAFKTGENRDKSERNERLMLGREWTKRDQQRADAKSLLRTVDIAENAPQFFA